HEIWQYYRCFHPHCTDRSLGTGQGKGRRSCCPCRLWQRIYMGQCHHSLVMNHWLSSYNTTNSKQKISNMNAHEIDYQINGEEVQYVEIELDPQEAVVAEAGSFMMMDSDIKMETIFGDGSNQDTGVLGKLFSAGKRLLTGESLFMTVFLNMGQGKKRVSFASPYPGKIIPIDLTEFQGKFVCQKDAFLCAAKGVSVGIECSKKLGRGRIGGYGSLRPR